MDPRNRPDRDYHALLAAYRDGERMPPRLREAVWERLRADPPGVESRPARARDRRRDWAWGIIVLAAALTLVVVGHRGQLHRAEDAARVQAAHDSHDAMTRELRAADPPSITAPALSVQFPVAAEPATSPPLLRPRVKSRALPSQNAAEPVNVSRIDAELALLAAARAALGTGAPAEALPHLAEYARRFPAGNLTEERMRLEIEARCSLGQRSEGRAIAGALQASFPHSPHLPAVATLCGE